MFGKKKEEPVVQKTKVVYDFENDKSKGLLGEAMAEAKNKSNKMKTQSITFELPKIDDEEFDEDASTQDEEDLQKLTEFSEEEPRDIKETIKRTIIGLFIFAVVVVACLLIWATNSDLFLLKNASIQSRVYVSSGDIKSIISGDFGENILLIKMSKIKKNIETNPLIYSAKVRRVLPDSLNISFVERTPKAVLKIDENNFVLDTYGVIISIDENAFENLLAISFNVSKEYKVGDTLTGTDIIKYKNILYLMEVASNINFEYKISSMWYENAEDIRMFIEDAQITVLYGPLNKEQADDKLLYLKEIVKKSKDQNLSGFLNMSADDYHKSVLNSNI